MVNITNQQKTTKPGANACCTSSLFSGLASKCFFWMEAPDLSSQQATSNHPAAALSFEDRATSEDDSGGEEESDKEEEEERDLSGRNSHSTSIKIP